MKKGILTIKKGIILSLGLISLGLVLIVLGVVLVFTKTWAWIDHHDVMLNASYVFLGIASGSWGFVSIVWGAIHSPLRKEVSSSIVSFILFLHILGLLLIVALIGLGSVGFVILIFIPCIIADAMGLHLIRKGQGTPNQTESAIKLHETLEELEKLLHRYSYKSDICYEV